VAFFISMPERVLAAALNHLLESEPWARERMAPFAGETLELRAPPLPALRLQVREGGLLDAAAPGAAPALVIALKADASAALLRGEEHFLRAVEVSGNARLAEAVMALVRHLRWDFEEDLSRALGDVAAHRVAGALRGFAAWQADAARRLADSLAVYATQEAPLLVRRAELDAHAAQVSALRDAVERLEQRLRRHG
jgi:ubiquinone biosynthesis protein UbiJ